jgi:hypothetical protein
MESSSSSERYDSSGSIPASQKHENLRRRDHRASPPTDTDDEDPFHFDSVLTSSPVKKKGDSSPGRILSSSVLRRASIIPVDPTAAPAPHRFSLLRERASDETIFVQEICDAEGRRWSLRVPASGLPEDMVRMLEELEKLAVELGQALPRIVVTCSAESLSLKQTERNAAANSSQLLRPPAAVGDKSPVGAPCDIGRTLAKEKCRVVENEQVAEEPARPPEPSSVGVSSPSEQSLTCIYLPEVNLPGLPCSVILIGLSRQLAPEFLSGSSTSPVLQPADGFHSKPAQAIHCPRQRAFFSALKEPQPTNDIAKRFMPHLSKTETESEAAASFFSSALPPAKSKPRNQVIKSKSALPVLKANSKASTTAAAAAEDDGRRRARLASISELPRRQDVPAPDAPSGAPDHSSQAEGSETAATMSPASAAAGSHQHQRHPTIACSFLSQPPPDRRGPTGADDALLAFPVHAPAAPPTGRKLRHLFRRPPVRSASDPPSYSYSVMDEGMKRPASEVVRAPREVVERRMPRLPSARDLLRKLT